MLFSCRKILDKYPKPATIGGNYRQAWSLLIPLTAVISFETTLLPLKALIQLGQMISFIVVVLVESVNL